MSMLYLLRHGQTEYNVARRVQGQCNSPLTERGIAQAHVAARWLVEQGLRFDRMCTSPLGRAADTLEIVRQEYRAAGVTDLPPVELVDGLIERSYGCFESGPAEDVPTELWDPGEALVPYGGEGSVALRRRIVDALTELMSQPGSDTVLAVSHGSITMQFKLAWEHLARCEQNVRIGNCSVMVFEFDPEARTFSNLAIVNHENSVPVA